MAGKIKKLLIILLLISISASAVITEAKSENVITFKDKNLYKALCKNFNWKGDFTKENASKLTKDNEHEHLWLDNFNISNLEGLQFFDNTTSIYLCGNNLKNLKPLSKLRIMQMLVISNNKIQGTDFEQELETMDCIKNLWCLVLNNNEISSISFMDNIGNMKNYRDVEMKNNKISDVSILKEATELNSLNLSNNRITDVTPLKNLNKLTFYLDLRDNCIIDYKPIKHLFDEMYEDFDDANGMDRYDFYKNPVNFKYNGKTIKFPYLTAYYKYQAYAEAIPLFKAIGGDAIYDKNTGTLTCNYKGKKLIMKDFSNKIMINKQIINLKYPMRRMQYDLAYIPVKDVCKIMGVKYKVKKTRFMDYGEHPPKLVELSKS